LYLLKQDYLISEERRLLEWALLYQNETFLLDEGLVTLPCQLEDFTTIHCASAQLSQELISSLLFIEQIITIFGFEAQWYLVASRQKSVSGRQEKETLKWLKKTLETLNLHFPLQEELLEEERLEGPRLELRLADEMGREWAGPSLTIVSNEANILIRRIFGPLGRLIALLIERWEGIFPLWLAPEQIRILAIGELSHAYSKEVEASCRRRGLRAALDLRQVKLGEKIHNAEKEKIPYLLIIGDQEIKKQSVTVRSIRRPGKSESMKLEELLDLIQQECVRPAPGPAGEKMLDNRED
jgi:threonyl-tRNA synthetase